MPPFHHSSSVLLLLAVFVHLSLSTRYVHGDHANGGHHHDLAALLSFKASNPNATALASWVGPDPCSGTWFGVRCYRGRVAGVFLDGASLSGTVAPLLGLGRLRMLAVRNNSLSGTLPPLENTTASPWLRHLLVSHNRLSGSLSVSLPALLTLRAEHNCFQGGLEALRVPMLRSLNVSGNKLAGEISRDLSRFPSSAFSGNLALCGHPLPKCVTHAYDVLGSDSSSSSNATATASPIAAPSPHASSVSSVSSSSSNGGFSKISLTALMATSIGNAVLITVSLAISVAMFVYVRRKLRSAAAKDDVPALCFEEEEKRDDDRCRKAGGLVCFDGGEELRLESLLKASAEVLGKGVSGSTYKAVLDDGIVVAVKRLSALQFPGAAAAGRSKAFDRHMRLVGRLRHRHVVSLRAYCSSNGERLLVYDFLPNGSLHSLLQATGGDSRNLDWAARKSILFGTAQGLNYIHTFPARPALVHANVKPSNIILDERGGACVSECGLMRYATNIQHSIVRQATGTRCSPPEPLFLDQPASGGGWHGYAAPELALASGSGGAAAGRATQESDVYSFGMVLLQVVTGGHNKAAEGGGGGEGGDETMRMVKIGMMCTAEAPEERPTMAQVLAMMSEFM